MNSTTKAVKATAKKALEGNFLKSVFAVMPLLLAVLITVNVANILSRYTAWYIGTAFSLLATVFAVVPIFTGTLRFFRRLIWNADDGVLVTHYLSSPKLYFRSVEVFLTVVYKTLPALIAVFIPYAAARIFSDNGIYELLNISMPRFASSLDILGYIFYVGAVVASFFILIRYYMVGFLTVADDDASAYEIINTAKIIYSRTSGDFLALTMSSIHYIIATLLMILAPIALPVLLCFYCVHCRFSISQYNITVKQLNERSVPTFVEGE